MALTIENLSAVSRAKKLASTHSIRNRRLWDAGIPKKIKIPAAAVVNQFENGPRVARPESSKDVVRHTDLCFTPFEDSGRATQTDPLLNQPLFEQMADSIQNTPHRRLRATDFDCNFR